MDKRRFIGALVVFSVLGLIFSGVSGMASASQEPAISIPEPGPGDTVTYSIREVIDDPELARGQLDFDWMRLRWDPAEFIPDATGVTRSFEPLRYHTMYREHTEYQLEFKRNTFYDPIDGTAFMDESKYTGRIGGGASLACINNQCAVGTPSRDTHTTARNVYGPNGVCGARASIQGADAAPKTMEVDGYCQDYWVQGSAKTTTYQFDRNLVWNDRDAVQYVQEGTALRLIYASGVPFPVLMDLPLAEHIAESYTIGRHFTVEVRGFELSGLAYAAPAAGPRDPLPLGPRVPVLQIDESGLEGFTLSEAYAVALSDTAQPQLAGFMARPGTYLGAAWKLHYMDADGRQWSRWSFWATDGDNALGKFVDELDGEYQTGLPLPEELNQYTVGNLAGEPSIDYPPIELLPSQIPELSSALQRATDFPGINEPNVWGFYVTCYRGNCNDITFSVRTGQELVPSNNPAVGVQSQPAEHQYLAFFDEDGLVGQTWSMEAEHGQQGLVSLPGGPANVPPSDEPARGDSAWVPPAPAAAASLGFVAVLGALGYYFWPLLKTGPLALFSRIEKPQILEHPRRREIHDAIAADPGIHFQELSRGTQAGRGALEHHLRKLETAGLIVRQQHTGRTCYFPRGTVDRQVMAATPLLRAPSTRRVFDQIARSPGSQCGDVADAVGLSNPTVSYHLNKLRKAGLVAEGRMLNLTEHGRFVRAAA